MKEFFKNIFSAESDVSSKRLMGVLSISVVLIFTALIVILDLKITNVALVSTLLTTIFIGGCALLGVSKFSEGFGKNK